MTSYEMRIIDWSSNVCSSYLLTASVERFLDRIRPRLAVVMETEIWPNLFITCAGREIPIVVANARLSEQSLRGYGPVRQLARRAIRCEIGRASGRERGCQYELISVSVEALKKKINNTN